MTDCEKLKDLFDEFGIEYEVRTNDKNWTIVYIEQGFRKVNGYCGFQSYYFFDEKGEFIKIGIWE